MKTRQADCIKTPNLANFDHHSVHRLQLTVWNCQVISCVFFTDQSHLDRVLLLRYVLLKGASESEPFLSQTRVQTCTQTMMFTFEVVVMNALFKSSLKKQRQSRCGV